jgi:hypothetical protein
MDCIVCRDFHHDDGEPCPSDYIVTVERTVPRIGTNRPARFGLCRECADGVNLTALVLADE